METVISSDRSVTAEFGLFTSVYSRCLFGLLSCLLVCTAVLKVYSSTFDPFVSLRFGIYKQAIVLIATFELAVALISISKATVIFKTVVNGATFSAFLFRNLSSSSATCFCFGGFLESPIITLIIDIAIIICLLVLTAIIIQLNGLTFVIRASIVPAIFCLGLAVPLLTVLGLSEFDPVGNPQIIVRISPFHGQIDKEIEVEFEIENAYRQPIKILGFESSCTCVVADELEGITLSIGDSIRSQLIIRPLRAGNFDQRLFFFLDSPPPNRFAVNVLGFVDN